MVKAAQLETREDAKGTKDTGPAVVPCLSVFSVASRVSSCAVFTMLHRCNQLAFKHWQVNFEMLNFSMQKGTRVLGI